MAALQSSLTVQLHHPNHGAIKLARLTTVSCYYDRRKRVHKIKKTYMGKDHFNRKGFRDLTGNIQQDLDVKIFAAPKISVDEIGTSLDSSKVEVEKGSTYSFRTETGGLVKVSVGRKSMKYAIYIEVSSLPQCSNDDDDELVLSWGLFRSDSSCFMPLDPQRLAPEPRSNTFETPFEQKTLGRYALQLEFESNEAPFYLSFILYSSDSGPSNKRIRSHRKTNFCVPVGVNSGYPAPLGVSFSSDGSVNFALFSRNAERVVLCLHNEMTDQPSLEIDLDPYTNRTGAIWHVSMESVGPYVGYGYRCQGTTIGSGGDRLHEPHVLLDPYAKILKNFSSDQSGSFSLLKCLGHLRTAPAFDWTGDVHPCVQMERLVVYRLNVRRFTEDRSSQLPADVAGTFSGVVEKLNHFKDLGVNAILLEPIFPFDEQKGPYFPYHFFSPMNLYGPTHDGISTINALKMMVKKLHENGIEVLLEVVFTHTAETGDSSCQMGALSGIDNVSYYVADGDVESTTRNALNCNYPVVQRMILDSLQHWVTEFHIDGFVFMNASLLRGSKGEYLSRPPLVEAIAFDPVLSKSKIIADCWDPSNMVSKEIQFPHWKRWAEMNTRFCHDVRQFLRGEGLLSDLATRLCGSGDIFSDGRGPAFSFNFIARNSGLPLVDLVSFSSDELSSELSWNCGEEGPTNKTDVLEKRLKQIRNFLFILYISLGVPVLNMGDECGQSAGGSMSYGDRKSFDWGALKTGFGVQIIQFIRFLSSLRMRRSDLLHKRNFMREENIYWHGSDLSQPRWGDLSCKFLAMTLKVDRDNCQFSSKSSHIVGDLFVALNSSDHPEVVILPNSTEGMAWLRLVDTAAPYPGFFSTSGDPVLEQIKGLVAYEMKPHSCVLFEAQSLRINTFTHSPSKEWFQTNAALRVSLGNFLFFATFSLIMVGVKDQNDRRDSWHHGGWILKIVVWALLIILMFFLPNVTITIYETVSKFGSGLFLLVQVILLLDGTHSWNDAWVEKDEQKWYMALLAVSVGCYLAAFTFSGILFIWFNPSGHDCSLNVFFIVTTMILAFVFAIIALHPQVNGSLLPASVISVYCAFVCYTGLSSEPRDYVCNDLHKNSKAMSMGTLILGMLTTVLSVLYSAVRAGSSTAFMSPPSSPKSGAKQPFLESEKLEEGKEKDTEARPVSYSYAFFHLIFALATMYSGMLLTGWTSSSESSELIDVGWTSVWIRIFTEWVTAALYVWTLLAPLIFPDREF